MCETRNETAQIGLVRRSWRRARRGAAVPGSLIGTGPDDRIDPDGHPHVGSTFERLAAAGESPGEGDGSDWAYTRVPKGRFAPEHVLRRPLEFCESVLRHVYRDIDVASCWNFTFQPDPLTVFNACGDADIEGS